MTATSLYDASREDLAKILAGQPRYRIDQVWEGLYTHLKTPSEISSLPNNLRNVLQTALPMSLHEVSRTVADDGDTIKFLWNLVDGGSPIETVLMYYEDRATVCVSTQAGCAMGCGFCATGQAGFTRHMTTGEIVEQVILASRIAAERDIRVGNVVFMGMGEPLANESAVWGAVEKMNHDMGISARHLTISTVGIIPGIRTLSQRPLPVNLAVSLHAARNDLRDELVPINKRYPIEDLMQSCREYLDKKNRRITFEWALIDGVNDTERDARELHTLCASLRPSAHVNLIPLNPTPGWPTRGSSNNKVHAFRRSLEALGTNATIRQNRGTDIAAACGQLAAGQPVTLGKTSRNN